MTTHRHARVALACALALVATTLFAGEIVLFEGENFQGYAMSFRDTAPNLDGTGFNDRAASISVRDGTWDVCFDADFQGGCMRLSPGDYPRLDPPFDRSISSLRQVGGAMYGGGYPAAPPPQDAPSNVIVLFDGEYLQGNRIPFADPVPNLDGTGFNDRVASISIRGGSWEVCFDANFQGPCMQLGPGDYPRLEPPFERNISSVRPVGGPEYGTTYAPPAPSPQVSLGIGYSGVSIGINLPLYPDLVPVPGYPVYYAPQVSSNYFFYDGMYWVYQHDNWYASSWYNGPWALVAPDAVPLYVLRVPVRYYRQPPTYFRGWRTDAPPRWDNLWGNSWTQSHRGWDNWNRNAAPAPAPLPTYQRQYSGNRYPGAAQQRTIESQSYRYQPRDPIVQQHHQQQRGQQGAAPGAQQGSQQSRPQQPPTAGGPQGYQQSRPQQPPTAGGPQGYQQPRAQPAPAPGEPQRYQPPRNQAPAPDAQQRDARDRPQQPRPQAGQPPGAQPRDQQPRPQGAPAPAGEPAKVQPAPAAGGRPPKEQGAPAPAERPQEPPQERNPGAQGS